MATKPVDKPAEPAAEAKPKKPPRPMNKTLQTLARIDRLLAEHTPEEIARMVVWLVGQHAMGRWKVIFGTEGDATPPVPPVGG